MEFEIPDSSGVGSSQFDSRSMIRCLKKKMMGLKLSESPAMVDISQKHRKRTAGVKRNFKKQSNQRKKVSAADFCLGDLINELVNFDDVSTDIVSEKSEFAIPTAAASVGGQFEELYFNPPEFNMADFLDDNLCF